MLESINERVRKDIIIPMIENGTAQEVKGADFTDRAGPIDSDPVTHSIKFYTLWGKIIRQGLNEATGEVDHTFVGGEDVELFASHYLNRYETEAVLNPSPETLEQWRQENGHRQSNPSQTQSQVLMNKIG